MRILFITNYYPPCEYGWGYMRICEQVADGMVKAGHDIAVLTSTYRNGPEYKPYPVHRLLTIEPDWESERSAAWQFFIGRQVREKEAIQHLHNLVNDFQPDVLFIWQIDGLSRAMLQVAENLPQMKVVYYFANYYPEIPDSYIPYWEATPVSGLTSKLFKQPLSKIALRRLADEGKPILLQYENSISVSGYVRKRLSDQKLIGSNAIVVPNGVDLDVFLSKSPDPESYSNSGTLKCLIAGRVSPEKGIHTVLKSFAQLHSQKQLKNVHLTILGDGPDNYKKELAEYVDVNGLQQFVTFKSPVPIEQMPSELAKQDILILPSEWDEPLACIMLEAMASGLLVIGTDTGGSGEALFHGKTGLVFKAGDSTSLSKQLNQVIEKPEIVPRLAREGQQEIIKNFNIDTVNSRVEEFLYSLVQEKVKEND